MPDNELFFSDQTEQSAIKARIVSGYFSAWAGVIQKWSSQMGYIDLFCGPGKYSDNKLSAPLLIVKTVLNSHLLSKKMSFIFNDYDLTNITALQHAIKELDNKSVLTGRIKYFNETVEQNFYSRLRIPPNVPILSFIDPFGYKGLTMNLIRVC